MKSLCYIGVILGYNIGVTWGIMEKKMETTIMGISRQALRSGISQRVQEFFLHIQEQKLKV